MRQGARLAAVLLLASAGCSVQRSGLAAGGEEESDGSTWDAQPREADARDASSSDASPMRDGEFDPASSDAGDSGATADGGSEVDAGPADAGFDAGAPSCASLYATARGYDLCAESETECELYVQLEGRSCETLCASAGGTCLAAHAEGGDSSHERRCTRDGARTCGSTHNDAICVCSKP